MTRIRTHIDDAPAVLGATGHGWGDEQVAGAFAYLGLTVFASCFVNYAATGLDAPAPTAPGGEGA